MSESNAAKKVGPSGMHPAVQAFRKKIASIERYEANEVDPLVEKIDAQHERVSAKRDSPPPKKDSRREEEIDGEEIRLDVVELEED